MVFKPCAQHVVASDFSKGQRKRVALATRVIERLLSVLLTAVIGGGVCAQEQAPAADAADHTQIAKHSERLKQSPRDVDTLVARGQAYHAVGDYEKEEADLEVATRLAPERSDTWHVYGQALFARDKVKEAIAAFDKAVALKSKDPLVFVDAGWHTKSLAITNRLLRISPLRLK